MLRAGAWAGAECALSLLADNLTPRNARLGLAGRGAAALATGGLGRENLALALGCLDVENDIVNLGAVCLILGRTLAVSERSSGGHGSNRNHEFLHYCFFLWSRAC